MDFTKPKKNDDDTQTIIIKIDKDIYKFLKEQKKLQNIPMKEIISRQLRRYMNDLKYNQ